MSDVFAGIDFATAVRDAQSGLLIKPILHNYLFDAKFPDFDMKFRKHQMHRDPDNWFHPSTHPMWPEAALYHYLTAKDFPVETMTHMSTLSVTVGQAMHGFMEVCMEDAGIRPKELNKCTVCPPKNKCKEPGVVDAETGSRGHMDGLLDLSSISVPHPAYEFPVVEFKTGNERKMAKIDDLDLAAYRATWPVYYAQNQEYMRMSGRRMTIVLFMVMGWPWEMTEIHVPYDPGFAQKVKEKYMRVRQAVADQSPPVSTCCRKFVSCPSGSLCRSVIAPPAATMLAF